MDGGHMGFKSLYNFLTKGTLLEEAFEENDHVHDLTYEMFLQSIQALIEHDKKLRDEVIKTDKIVNREFIKIRRKLFEYLSISAAPNISACLILSNVAIDYERIGDYCKNIAQLVEWYHVKFKKDRYLEWIVTMRDCIDRMFKSTREAMTEEDSEVAEQVLGEHAKIKEIHAEILKALTMDQEITVKEAIVIAKVGGFLRRVSAHLGNICTGVLRPFPKMGFLKKPNVDVLREEELYSRSNLD